MAWIIYKHTNKINGKVYIGQTCKKPEYRWNNGKGYLSTDTHFSRAINFYGWDNFEHKVIEENVPSVEKANEREIYWIKFYNSYENGYNDTYGGYNHDHEGKEIYQIKKDDLSIVNKFKSISFAAKKLKILPSAIGSCCRRERIETHNYYWCFVKDYLNFKPREYQLAYVPVLMLDKNNYQVIKKFKSLKDASIYMNTNHSNIMNVCKRRNTYSNGFCWCYEKDYYEGWRPKERLQGEHGHIPVVCFETKKIYKSYSDAARDLKTSTGNIYECVKHPQKTVKNMHFVLLEKFNEKYLPPLKISNKRKVYCLETDYVYDSISDCASKLGLRQSQIVEVCKGHLVVAGGYHFCYEEDKNKVIFKEGKQRKIYCFETDTIYSSHKEAFQKTKIRHIVECCKGTVNTAGGYHWCYLSEKGNYRFKIPKNKKRIRCVETKEIFEKMKEASIKYSIDATCLSECCKGRQKTTGGYHWEYID